MTGFHLVNGWAKERICILPRAIPGPSTSYRIISNGSPWCTTPTVSEAARRPPARTCNSWPVQDEEGRSHLVKVAVSAVSADNALKNLDAEIPDWDFEKVRRDTREKWDRELSRIQIEGSQEEKETFYTAMYHAFTTPNLYEDVNRRVSRAGPKHPPGRRDSRTMRSFRCGTPTAPRIRCSP